MRAYCLETLVKHLNTKLGTFWIMELNSDTPEPEQRYYLGVGDEELGLYSNPTKAVEDVCNQSTGFLKWDSQMRVTAPNTISDWEEGIPESWN